MATTPAMVRVERGDQSPTGAGRRCILEGGGLDDTIDGNGTVKGAKCSGLCQIHTYDLLVVFPILSQQRSNTPSSSCSFFNK